MYKVTYIQVGKHFELEEINKNKNFTQMGELKKYSINYF